MNLISNKLHRLYLVITLLLVIPDTFYWYTLNDYSNYQDAFTAITSSTGLTWLIVSYLALFFAIFAQNLEMRAFLTVAAFVTRIFFLVWLTDIWRSNEVGFAQVIKNVFVKTGEAPYVEAFATVALIPMVLTLIVQKTQVANLLTGLVNFLKAPANKTHQVVFYTASATIYLLALIGMVRSLLDNYDLAASDLPSGVTQSLIWLVVLGVIQIALKLLILGLGLLASLWAWISWQADIKTVLGHMKDFKLSEYLTRKVASYLYTFYFLFIIGLAAVGIPIYASTTYGINQDYAAFPMVALAGVIVTFLVILAIRLVFELAVAVVHIAENTKSGLRK
ncbi:DUF4282 domain-containing protein [Candidatus Nanopelagicus limnes]|uniref:DUF4282 domain-containing protein n=1 Tax=Candidatus Nanopelagicus limnae TaxID=1884634 RepID=A0A249JZA8_9ACTN|nr:DUF4282 domain-containing protein [Candidatus Nanopelagicus limnes]ASY09861.1 DUF4282 domain-containing protein [Candidatus Nanopelagicus limnes]